MNLILTLVFSLSTEHNRDGPHGIGCVSAEREQAIWCNRLQSAHLLEMDKGFESLGCLGNLILIFLGHEKGCKDMKRRYIRRQYNRLLGRTTMCHLA